MIVLKVKHSILINFIIFEATFNTTGDNLLSAIKFESPEKADGYPESQQWTIKSCLSHYANRKQLKYDYILNKSINNFNF